MANRIRTGDSRGFYKRRSSKFHVGSRVPRTPKEGQRTYRPKRCINNNKDKDNSLKTLIDKNHQASSQKFRQLLCFSILVSFGFMAYQPLLVIQFQILFIHIRYI